MLIPQCYNTEISLGIISTIIKIDLEVILNIEKKNRTLILFVVGHLLNDIFEIHTRCFMNRARWRAGVREIAAGVNQARPPRLRG